ncbi:MAG: DUF3105 domain-containing protein [Actinobacteria bacterium]|nr:MAG: DUF3105 domain-containing protein [Actinomycetota bacterium]
MARREEEKRRRREERVAAEQAAAQAAKRRRTLQIVGGVALAVVAVALIVVAVTTSGGGGPKPKPTSNANDVKLPAAKITDLNKAAAAAGCTLHDYPDFGNQHVLTPVTYKTNPPTSGPHNPTPASDGIYDPGKEPAKENLVHALEHGRVEIQYRPGTSPTQIAQLKSLFDESLTGKTNQAPQAGYKKLLFQNGTNMPYAVAAVAWQHVIGCSSFNPRIFDALRAFSVKYVDTAPESGAIPFPE